MARAQTVGGRAPGAAIPARPLEIASEEQLGDALLALVARARAEGWDAERALRTRTRVLEEGVRRAEAGLG